MSRKWSVLWVFVSLPLIAGIIAFAQKHRAVNQIDTTPIQVSSRHNNLPSKIKSGNLAPDYSIDFVLSDIEKMGFNTVNIPVLINVPSVTSNDMSVDLASKQKAIQLLKKLQSKQVHVIVEPFPWIAGGTIGETEWNPMDHKLFFQQWRSQVLRELLQGVAVPYQADAVTAGSNLVELEADVQPWIETIEYVKNNFTGLVTYRTNWWLTAGLHFYFSVF
jgi:hypothetical protein